MNSKPILATAITLMISPLFAEPNSGSNSPKKKDQVFQRQFNGQMFQKLDSNQDKAISLEEFKANSRLQRASDEQKEKLFNRIDKNKDGLIKRNEIRSPHGGRPRMPILENGPVTFEEFQQQERISKLPEEAQRRLFNRMDRNEDGRISQEDFPRQRHGMRDQKRKKGAKGPHQKKFNPRELMRFDDNQDGSVSFEEFRKAPFIAKLNEDDAEDRFEMLDKNGDAKLSPDDFPKKPKKPSSGVESE